VTRMSHHHVKKHLVDPFLLVRKRRNYPNSTETAPDTQHGIAAELMSEMYIDEEKKKKKQTRSFAMVTTLLANDLRFFPWLVNVIC
jgi:hypothetical protein